VQPSPSTWQDVKAVWRGRAGVADYIRLAAVYGSPAQLPWVLRPWAMSPLGLSRFLGTGAASTGWGHQAIRPLVEAHVADPALRQAIYQRLERLHRPTAERIQAVFAQQGAPGLSLAAAHQIATLLGPRTISGFWTNQMAHRGDQPNALDRALNVVAGWMGRGTPDRAVDVDRAQVLEVARPLAAIERASPAWADRQVEAAVDFLQRRLIEPTYLPLLIPLARASGPVSDDLVNDTLYLLQQGVISRADIASLAQLVDATPHPPGVVLLHTVDLLRGRHLTGVDLPLWQRMAAEAGLLREAVVLVLRQSLESGALNRGQLERLAPVVGSLAVAAEAQQGSLPLSYLRGIPAELLAWAQQARQDLLVTFQAGLQLLEHGVYPVAPLLDRAVQTGDPAGVLGAVDAARAAMQQGPVRCRRSGASGRWLQPAAHGNTNQRTAVGSQPGQLRGVRPAGRGCGRAARLRPHQTDCAGAGGGDLPRL